MCPNGIDLSTSKTGNQRSTQTKIILSVSKKSVYPSVHCNSQTKFVMPCTLYTTRNTALESSCRVLQTHTSFIHNFYFLFYYIHMRFFPVEYWKLKDTTIETFHLFYWFSYYSFIVIMTCYTCYYDIIMIFSEINSFMREKNRTFFFHVCPLNIIISWACNTSFKSFRKVLQWSDFFEMSIYIKTFALFNGLS